MTTTDYPPHFAESRQSPPIGPAAITDQLPDLIVAENAIEARAYLDALGCDVTGWLPNVNPKRFKAQVIRGEQLGAVMTSPVEDLTVNEVRGKVLCGVVPLWLAMHALLVIVFEPAVETPDYDWYTLAGKPQPPLRLSAYRIHRAAADPIEGMTLDSPKGTPLGE